MSLPNCICLHDVYFKYTQLHISYLAGFTVVENVGTLDGVIKVI